MPNEEGANPITQPDGEAAWNRVLAKLTEDEKECLTHAIQQVQKVAFSAGFRYADSQRKARNAKKRETRLRRN